MSNVEAYALEKSVWTEEGFEVMSWHDSTLWAMLANAEEFEFLFDLDYIFKWVHPRKGETHFKFWVAPVTMVFENAHEVKIDIGSSQGCIEIVDLLMENPKPTPNGEYTEHTYRFECQEGEISLKATGFKMYVRQNPTLSQGQGLGLKDRKGISFERELNSL